MLPFSFSFLKMWTTTSVVRNLNIQNVDQRMQERLNSLQPIDWTVQETTTLTPVQKSICILRKNRFTYREIQNLTGISSPNTISSLIKYTACGVPFEIGRQGGRYSIFSETLCKTLKAQVHFRRHNLNCMKTYEAKQLIIEELEQIQERALQRLKNWGSETLQNEVIEMFAHSILTDDIFRYLCQKCDIFIASGENLELVRRKSCNKPVIENFYGLITDLVINYDPSYKFNADETGLSSKRTFKILTEDHNIKITLQPNQFQHISCMLCFNEAGMKLPPFFILSKHNGDFRELSNIPDIFYGTSQNGWMTSHLWSIWCILFVSFISMKRDARQLQRDKPVILFVDGHMSRLDPFGMRILKQYNIICIVFPSHCSHVIQPFDVCIGSPLKTYYLQEAISRIITKMKQSDLNQTEIIRRQRVLAFLNAWNRISVPLMQESFASAGLGRESFGAEHMTHYNLVADPTTQVEHDTNVSIRSSPINGKVATDNINLLDPYIVRKVIDGKFKQLKLEPGDFTPDIIAMEWFSGNSTIGKVFNDIVPIYENGTNIMYSFTRNSA